MLGVPIALLAALLATPPGPPEAAAEALPSPTVLGLALSGGGARGFAHIGVLRALEECGLEPDAIAGTSIGALVGALYAIGYTPDDLADVATRPDWADVFLGKPERGYSLLRRREARWPMLRLELDGQGARFPRGLVPTERLEQLLSVLILRAAGSTDFDRLDIPFRAVTTDIETGAKVVPDRGSLATVLRASMAIPGVFGPVEVEDRVLFDGGLVDNLPVDEVRRLGADLVVAVDVTTPLKSRDELKSFLDVLDQSLTFRMAAGVTEARADAEVVIEPEIGAVSNFAFTPAATRDLITCGEEAGRAACAEILRRIDGPRGPRRQTAAHADAVRVRELKVSGTGATGSALARRVFGRLPQNGVLPLRELERRLALLRAVGYFERVGVDLADPGPAGGVLELHLVEAAPFALQVAARVDDKVKALGRAALIWRQPIGPVRDLTADVTFGDIFRARLEARHDRWTGIPFLLSLAGYHDHVFDGLVVDGDSVGDLFFDRDGFSVATGVAVGKAFLTVGYELESVRTTGRPSFAGFPEDRFRLGRVVVRAAIDTTGRGDYPVRGVRMEARLAAAPEFLGSELEHGLFTASFAHHASPWRRTVLYLRARGATRIGGGALPLSEQPVGGGNDVFPGYPRDAFRGDRLAAGGLGARWTIATLPPAIGNVLYVGAEAAAGSVWGGFDELSARGRLLSGLAVYGGLETRLGPMEVKLGIADDNDRQVTFEAGPRF